MKICIMCAGEWWIANPGADKFNMPASKIRPAPYPGPRCATHHRATKKRRQQAAADFKRAVRYGLTGTAYRMLLEAQGGVCGGCGCPPPKTGKRLAVDHDHKQAKLDGHDPKQACGRCRRGLLCYKCNDTLAKYLDNAAQLQGLVNYLGKWNLTREVLNARPEGDRELQARTTQS